MIYLYLLGLYGDIIRRYDLCQPWFLYTYTPKGPRSCGANAHVATLSDAAQKKGKAQRVVDLPMEKKQEEPYFWMSNFPKKHFKGISFVYSQLIANPCHSDHGEPILPKK